MFSACYDDFEETITEQEEKEVVVYTDEELTGMVVNENGDALAGINILFGGQEKQSEGNGLFYFDAQKVEADKAVIEILNADQPPLYKTIFAGIYSKASYTRLVLHTQWAEKSTSANINNELNFIEGGKIFFMANSWQGTDGNDYSGEITVRAFSSKVNTQLKWEALPGSALGKDNENKNVILNIYSAAWIDWIGQNGETLQIDNHKKATLQFPLTNQWKLPESTTLWYYDANSHYWRNAGTATKDGSVYTAQITKPGYYCVGEPAEITWLEGTLQYNNTPLRNMKIVVRSDIGSYGQIIYTANDGKWRVPVAHGKDIPAEVYLPCGTLAKQKTFAGQQQSPQSIVWDLTTTNVSFFRLKGNLYNCDNEKIEKAVFYLSGNGNNSFYFVKESAYDFYIPDCYDNTVNILSSNATFSTYGPFTTWQIEPEINMRSNLICNDAQEEYITVRIGGQRKIYWEATSEIINSRFVIHTDNAAYPNVTFDFFFNDDKTGIYPNTDLNFLMEDTDFAGNHYRFYCPTSPDGCGLQQLHIIQSPAQAGEWIRGVFYGTLWILNVERSEAAYQNCEIEFQVRRDY